MAAVAASGASSVEASETAVEEHQLTAVAASGASPVEASETAGEEHQLTAVAASGASVDRSRGASVDRVALDNPETLTESVRYEKKTDSSD